MPGDSRSGLFALIPSTTTPRPAASSAAPHSVATEAPRTSAQASAAASRRVRRIAETR
ncbi:MAG: hypothetical protein LC774_09180 [Acidobacteria bacterium]|nr:hypothetical protein [Acidobacteriota bacterium]